MIASDSTAGNSESRASDQIQRVWLTSADVLGASRAELRAAAVAQLDCLTAPSVEPAERRADDVESRLREALRGVVPVADATIAIAGDERGAIATALRIVHHHWAVVDQKQRRLLLSVGGPLEAAAGWDFTVIEDPGYRSRRWLHRALGLLRDRESELAAVFIEPLVQTVAGVAVAEPAEVALFADAVQAHGIPLVCDESTVGLGRTGTLFACEQCLIGPDLLCLGRNLTSGYLPLGAVAVGRSLRGSTQETLEQPGEFDALGRKLGCAAAVRHLEILTGDTILDCVPERAAEMRRLLSILEGHCLVAGTTQRGLIAGISVTSGAAGAAQLCALLGTQGIHIERTGAGVALAPPLTVTRPELERLCGAMLATLDDMVRPDGHLSVDADAEKS